MIPEGIEPSIFGTGIRRVAIAPWNHLLMWERTHRHFVRLPIYGSGGSKKGAIRESNPRPPAPKAGIIPLDQSPELLTKKCTLWDSNPRPHRGSELESDALTNSAKGALLSVNAPLCASGLCTIASGWCGIFYFFVVVVFFFFFLYRVQIPVWVHCYTVVGL
jgi:hypothetical protein